MKEVIYTQLRVISNNYLKDHYIFLITDHHLIKLRGHSKQGRGHFNMQCDIILET